MSKFDIIQDSGEAGAQHGLDSVPPYRGPAQLPRPPPGHLRLRLPGEHRPVTRGQRDGRGQGVPRRLRGQARHVDR